MNLTQEEITQCRKAFASFDTDRSGSIDIDELQAILVAMRIEIADEELTHMIGDVTDTMTGSLDFPAFLKVIEALKTKSADIDNARDLVNAWDALGGMTKSGTKSGQVNRELLHNIMQDDFGLTINIEDLIRQIDADENGDVEFDEFKKFLGGV